MAKCVFRHKKHVGKNIYIFYPLVRSIIKYHCFTRELFYVSPGCTQDICDKSSASCVGCSHCIH